MPASRIVSFTSPAKSYGQIIILYARGYMMGIDVDPFLRDLYIS